jgi:hypothetical protein
MGQQLLLMLILMLMTTMMTAMVELIQKYFCLLQKFSKSKTNLPMVVS